MPNDNVIDHLSIEIEAQTGDATRRLGKVVSALKVLSTTLSGISMPKLGLGKATIANLNGFQSALQSLDLAKLSSLSTILNGMKGLRTGISSVSAANITNFSQGIKSLDISKLQQLSSINFSNLNSLTNAARAFGSLTGQISTNAKVATKAETAQKRLSTATHSVRRATRGAHHTFSLANTALGKLFNSIKRIAFYRMIRSAIKAVTQGFGEGIENLYRWSQAWGTSFAPAMDQLKTAQTYLKNGFASMFSPLIEYAIPIIDRVVDRLVDMFNAVQELFAQLTGAATWNKAIKYPVKYKDDLDNAAKSAKALQNILMDFDEINAINTPNEGGRGSGKEQEDYSKMFELVETKTGKGNSSIEKFGEFLKKLDFDPLKNSLKRLWTEGLSPIVTYFAENTGGFLEPLAKFFAEEGLPTAINLVTAALKPFLDIVQPLLDSGFFEDIAGKLSKVNESVQKFADFFGKLNFKPIGEAISSLWNNTLSPIIDKLIGYADFIREKVLQPITQFLVEKGIPAAIGVIEEALRAIWSILEPIFDGLSSFWDRNGSWIMNLIEEHTMTALNKIREAFRAIGDYFRQNGDKISGIFENIGIIFEKLRPVIEKIVEMIGTHAWDTFVNSIRDLLDHLQPILDIVSGIFEIIAGIITGDWSKVKHGVGDIGKSLISSFLAPLRVILRVLATILDVIGTLAPGAKELAHQIRVAIGDETDAVAVTEELEETANKFIRGTISGMNGVANSIDEVDAVMSSEEATFRKMQRGMNNLMQTTGITATTTAEEVAAAMGTSVDLVRQGLGKSADETITVLDVMTRYYQLCEHYGAEPLAEATYGVGAAIESIDPANIRNVEEAVLNGKRALEEAHAAGEDAFISTEAWAAYCIKYGLDPFTAEIFDAKNALNDLDSKPFDDVKTASTYARIAIANIGEESRESFTKSQKWIDWCNKFGLEPMTGLIREIDLGIDMLPDTTEKATNKVVGPVTAAIDRVRKVFESSMNSKTGESLGFDMGQGFADGLNSALKRSKFSAQIDIEEVTHQTIVQYKKQVNLDYEGQKLAMRGFASGGFPAQGSLFYAGEGSAELLGTVGGRTAVAGEKEITGIRDAIIEQGQREEGLLRQLISAVANKDLTLVANSKTGRWVNQSLKAYAGVTG